MLTNGNIKIYYFILFINLKASLGPNIEKGNKLKHIDKTTPAKPKFKNLTNIKTKGTLRIPPTIAVRVCTLVSLIQFKK